MINKNNVHAELKNHEDMINRIKDVSGQYRDSGTDYLDNVFDDIAAAIEDETGEKVLLSDVHNKAVFIHALYLTTNFKAKLCDKNVLDSNEPIFLDTLRKCRKSPQKHISGVEWFHDDYIVVIDTLSRICDGDNRCDNVQVDDNGRHFITPDDFAWVLFENFRINVSECMTEHDLVEEIVGIGV